jgi:hypothetical protein
VKQGAGRDKIVDEPRRSSSTDRHSVTGTRSPERPPNQAGTDKVAKFEVYEDSRGEFSGSG